MHGYSSFLTVHTNQSGPSKIVMSGQISLLKNAVRFIHDLVFLDTLPEIMNN
jgi:hypothetical protein